MNNEPTSDHPDAGHDPKVSSRIVKLAPWVLVVVLGVALAAVSLDAQGDHDAMQPITIVPSSQTASVWEPHLITRSKADRGQPAPRMVYTHGELRVASTKADTTGNLREVWTTGRDYSDVDVTARINPPSSLGGTATLQPGIALRTHINSDGSGSAIILDANIWAHDYSTLQINVWKWPASFSHVLFQGPRNSVYMPTRLATIVGVHRKAGHPATDMIVVDRNSGGLGAYGFKVGDHVDISSSMDLSYTQTDAVIKTVYGNFLLVDNPGQTKWSPAAAAVGEVRFHRAGSVTSPKFLYPRYIRARIVGNTLDVKSWLAEDPEPGWQRTVKLTDASNAPPSGKAGLVTNHLRGANQYIAFGEVSITPVHAP